MKLWAFNRRTLVDQTIFVEAKSLSEAWSKARADDAEDASDMAVVGRSTLRRLPEHDPSTAALASQEPDNAR